MTITESLTSSWAIWVPEHACIATLDSELNRSQWNALHSLLPVYRAVTMLKLGNGRNTSWFDAWDILFIGWTRNCEIFEISRLSVGTKNFTLSPEIFRILKFVCLNRHQSPPNALTLIHVSFSLLFSSRFKLPPPQHTRMLQLCRCPPR